VWWYQYLYIYILRSGIRRLRRVMLISTFDYSSPLNSPWAGWRHQ
jgi:hypothetical protein